MISERDGCALRQAVARAESDCSILVYSVGESKGRVVKLLYRQDFIDVSSNHGVVQDF